MRLTRVFLLPALVLVALSAAPVLRADVTVRYKFDVKTGALVPASVLQQAAGAAGAQKVPTTISDSLIQIKGDKIRSNTVTGETLLDYTKQEITVIDTANQRYATVFLTDYLSEVLASLPKMPAMPPEVRPILQSLKTRFVSNQTGRTDTVLGVPVEETQWTLTLELPTEGLPLPPGAFPPGQPLALIQIVAQNWTATAGAMANNPALGELAAHHPSAALAFDPNGLIPHALDAYPGIREGLTEMLKGSPQTPTVVLKSHLEIYIPVAAQIIPLIAAQGQKIPPGMDPNAPLAEISMEASDLSSAPIDDAVFQVPSGYRAMPLADVLKSRLPAPAAAPPSATAVPAPSSAPATGAGNP